MSAAKRLYTDHGVLSSDRNRLIDHMVVEVTDRDLELAANVAKRRPPALRKFDQIAMMDCDLARQVKMIAPCLAGQRVAFVGDHDGTAVLLGLMAQEGIIMAPAELAVFDFDERLLDAMKRIATEFGFISICSFNLYNVFDRVPQVQSGTFDWFYTNPPYGRYNNGASIELFTVRGCELVGRRSGKGCIIMPSDDCGKWARHNTLCIQALLNSHGWAVREKMNGCHRYHLDDDDTLTSCQMIIDRVIDVRPESAHPSFFGRFVDRSEVPRFYGRHVVMESVPRYIQSDGTEAYW